MVKAAVSIQGQGVGLPGCGAIHRTAGARAQGSRALMATDGCPSAAVADGRVAAVDVANAQEAVEMSGTDEGGTVGCCGCAAIGAGLYLMLSVGIMLNTERLQPAMLIAALFWLAVAAIVIMAVVESRK